MATASLDATLAALADPSRRQVVDLLRTGPRAAGELAAAVKMSPPAMSRHLRILRLRGVVEEESARPEDSRIRMYRLRREPFTQLSSWLTEVQSFWTDQLVSFKGHAENQP